MTFEVIWNIVFLVTVQLFLLIFLLSSTPCFIKQESKRYKAEMQGGEKDKVIEWMRRTRYGKLDTLK